MHNLKPILILILTVATATAQQYTIENWSVGGSGTSTGGTWAVSGTVGQANAGVLSGGDYTLAIGFWGIVAGVPPSAPTLFLTAASPGKVMISWSPRITGFRLQVTDTLLPTTWISISDGATNAIIVPTKDSTKYYRLISP